jgi:hypothetical protein
MLIVTNCGLLGQTLVQLGKGNETTASFEFPTTFDTVCATNPLV